MAEHKIDVKVEGSVDKDAAKAAKAAKAAARETNKQLRSVAGAAARLSPEFAALSKNFRTILGLTSSFGLSLKTFTAYGAAFTLLGKSTMALVDHFKQAADVLAATINDLQGFQGQAMATRARRMLEGGVTDAERSEAMIRMKDAEFRRKNLEDLQMETAKKAAKYPNADRAAAEIINRFMKSGLYSAEQINDLVDQNGKFSLKALTDDLQKRISGALAEETQWRKVVEYKEKPETVKEPKAAKAPDMSKYVNQLDKIGGYMGRFTANLANIGVDKQLDELKRQTVELQEIANNTKDSTSRYR